MKTVCIVGLGYIGLPTAGMFASNGFDIKGVDINPDVVRSINSAKVHIEEPGLDEIITDVVKKGRLKAYDTIQEADVYVIAVPTPIKQNKKAHLGCVEDAATSILGVLKPNDLVILESTSPVGTTKDIIVPILEKSGLVAGEDFFVAYCPEKVLPGNIIEELCNNERIIGGVNEKSSLMAKELYSSFCKAKIHLSDSNTTEMVKMMENTYRDVNIALANEFALMSKDFGVNMWDAIQLANLHPRVNVHQPGPGVGGHCISVDPWFIVEKSPDLSRLIRQARSINDSMPEFVTTLILEQLKDIQNPKVTMFGLSYKPDIDDMRESPLVRIVELLRDADINVGIYEPHIKEYSASFEDALRDSDFIVLGVNHKEFERLSPTEIAPMMRNKFILDTRNSLSRNEWESLGYKYILLGNQ